MIFPTNVAITTAYGMIDVTPYMPLNKEHGIAQYLIENTKDIFEATETLAYFIFAEFTNISEFKEDEVSFEELDKFLANGVLDDILYNPKSRLGESWERILEEYKVQTNPTKKAIDNIIQMVETTLNRLSADIDKATNGDSLGQFQEALNKLEKMQNKETKKATRSRKTSSKN